MTGATLYCLLAYTQVVCDDKGRSTKGDELQQCPDEAARVSTAGPHMAGTARAGTIDYRPNWHA